MQKARIENINLLHLRYMGAKNVFPWPPSAHCLTHNEHVMHKMLQIM